MKKRVRNKCFDLDVEDVYAEMSTVVSMLTS